MEIHRDRPFTVTHQLVLDRRDNTYGFFDFKKYCSYHQLTLDEAKTLVKSEISSDELAVSSHEEFVAFAEETGLAINVVYHD